MAQPITEGRSERRKRDTHDRLLHAAFRLMAERGADAVTIAEITEAADVGFGSFYNHFASKEAIRAAVLASVFDAFADTLDDLEAHLDDPAEVIAVSVRHTLRRATREPLWGRLLVREGWSDRAVSSGLGARLLRDLQRGVDVGRFTLPDPLVGVLLAGGTVLAAVALVSAPSAPSAQIGLAVDLDDLPERTATALLQSLGLGATEAAEVARRPLP